MATMSDRLPGMVSGEDLPPIARLVGFRVTAAGDGAATVELDADSRHANPMGTVHGGILCDIADAAMGIAYASTLGEGESCKTIELKINFFNPGFAARLTAAARVVRRGRLVGYVECDVTDEAGALVAKAASTCMTLSGDKASGR
jgi:uncharacterized protein (TIGR00369 family)